MTDEQLQKFVDERIVNGPDITTWEAAAKESGFDKNPNYVKTRQALIEQLIPSYLKEFGAYKTYNERYGQSAPAARSGWSIQAVD